MKRIWAQCTKELLQFQRDRLTLALAFLLPVMTLLIYGFAIRLEAQHIPIVIQDFDRSFLSSSYIDSLLVGDRFNRISALNSDPPRSAIDRGISKVALVIPPDFSRSIKAGQTSTVEVLIDGTDTNNAKVIENSIEGITHLFLEGLQGAKNRSIATVKIWFNPERKESLYIVPGVYAVVLWIYPSLLAAIAIVREKEQATLLQVYASSLSALEFVLGKGLAYLLVGISQAVSIEILGSLIFKLGFAGDPFPLLIGTPLFLANSVMFGLLVGIRASNQNIALQNVSVVGFLSCLLLSGFIYPLNNIPFPLSLLSNIIPARYYIELTRDAFVRGTGWPFAWYRVVMLALLGLLLFIVARSELRRMQLPD